MIIKNAYKFLLPTVNVTKVVYKVCSIWLVITCKSILQVTLLALTCTGAKPLSIPGKLCYRVHCLPLIQVLRVHHGLFGETQPRHKWQYYRRSLSVIGWCTTHGIPVPAIQPRVKSSQGLPSISWVYIVRAHQICICIPIYMYISMLQYNNRAMTAYFFIHTSLSTFIVLSSVISVYSSLLLYSHSVLPSYRYHFSRV